MDLVLAYVSARKLAKNGHVDALIDEYLVRSRRYGPIAQEGFRAEAELLAAAERRPGRAAAALVLFDSRGELPTSASFAAMLGRQRDSGTQRMMLAIGPADGWSAAATGRAAAVVSFGRVTLPHELARLVAAEQVYRALTILAGHPYHCGH